MLTADRLVTPVRLKEFFAPRSIAVVGASEASGWTGYLFASAAAAGFDGPLIPVHPKHKTVFGRPAVASLRDLAEPVDLAFVMAPLDAVESVLDDAVVDAALRQLNVIRVASIEELLTTAALLGYPGRPRGRRMGVVTTSGGACDLIADLASPERIEIPPFAETSATAIGAHLPPFAQARNPLDVTGYFLANRRNSALTAADLALDEAVNDPGLDFVLYGGLVLPDARPPVDTLAQRVSWLARRIASAPIPVICVSTTCVDLYDYGRELLATHGVHRLPGIDLGVRAIGNALRWQDGRGRAAAGRAPVPPTPGGSAGSSPRVGAAVRINGPWPEADARELLAAFGVPSIPTTMAKATGDALDAAHGYGYPVVLKISSSEITHKSDLGGVALDLRTDAEVAAAFDRLIALGPDLDGVTVAPMRTGGIELLAGVSVDPTFGPVLAVGLGGIWVEVLDDISLRLLPVDHFEVLRMLGELRGAPLLTGSRGQVAADLDALAQVITSIGDAALSLGSALRSLEVNPLWVCGAQIEALDVLVVTAGPRATDQHGRSS